VDIGEEVVDERVDGGERADGLSGQLLRLGRLQLGEGMGGIGGGLGRVASSVRVNVVQPPLLDVFGVSVGRSPPAAGAIKGAWDLERDAGSTRRTRLVTLQRVIMETLIPLRRDETAAYLDFAYAARVACLAQTIRLLLLLLMLRRLGQRRQRMLSRAALVVQGVVRVQRVGLQHLVQVLDLGVGRFLRVGPTRRALAIVEL
jgi:hypothetical protein